MHERGGGDVHARCGRLELRGDGDGRSQTGHGGSGRSDDMEIWLQELVLPRGAGVGGGRSGRCCCCCCCCRSGWLAVSGSSPMRGHWSCCVHCPLTGWPGKTPALPLAVLKPPTVAPHVTQPSSWSPTMKIFHPCEPRGPPLLLSFPSPTRPLDSAAHPPARVQPAFCRFGLRRRGRQLRFRGAENEGKTLVH